jgi:hypothetical protein
MGFILVLTFDRLFLLNASGALIKTVDLEREIFAWVECVSLDGFDYVAFAQRDNQIGFFEAMYPEKRTILFAFNELVSLTHKRSAQCLVAISRTGRVKFFPLNLHPQS